MVNEGSPHIRRGYRIGLSFSQCLRSMFQLHNETINVWSHVLGAMLFISLVFYVKDSPAFERPRAIALSVVSSIPFQTNFNSSIFEQVSARLDAMFDISVYTILPFRCMCLTKS